MTGMKKWLIKFLKDVGLVCNIIFLSTFVGIGLSLGFLIVLIVIHITRI